MNWTRFWMGLFWLGVFILILALILWGISK
jgi:hypothetical protein